jgi:acyl carrier protein
MDKQEIYVKLDEIFSDVFMRDDIALKPETTANEVEGWDSFKMMDIVMAVEQVFDFRLLTEELDTMESVGDLVAAIERGTSKT